MSLLMIIFVGDAVHASSFRLFPFVVFLFRRESPPTPREIQLRPPLLISELAVEGKSGKKCVGRYNVFVSTSDDMRRLILCFVYLRLTIVNFCITQFHGFR